MPFRVTVDDFNRIVCLPGTNHSMCVRIQIVLEGWIDREWTFEDGMSRLDVAESLLQALTLISEFVAQSLKRHYGTEIGTHQYHRPLKVGRYFVAEITVDNRNVHVAS